LVLLDVYLIVCSPELNKDIQKVKEVDDEVINLNDVTFRILWPEPNDERDMETVEDSNDDNDEVPYLVEHRGFPNDPLVVCKPLLNIGGYLVIWVSPRCRYLA
jgi:hypothetical protein